MAGGVYRLCWRGGGPADRQHTGATQCSHHIQIAGLLPHDLVDQVNRPHRTEPDSYKALAPVRMDFHISTDTEPTDSSAGNSDSSPRMTRLRYERSISNAPFLLT